MVKVVSGKLGERSLFERDAVNTETATFAQRLRKKMRMDRLARQVYALPAEADGPRKIDKEAMRLLLAETDRKMERARDLELYTSLLPTGRKDIMVMDGDLPVYRNTTVDEVLVHKSPTVKEMVHNFVKILYNDKALVSTKRQDTVNAVHREILDQLDLSFTQKDIEEMGAETRACLETADAPALVKNLALFGALLGYNKTPSDVFDSPGVESMGRFTQSRAKTAIIGPCVFYVTDKNRLGFIEKQVDLGDKDKRAALLTVVAGSGKADAEGAHAVDALVREVVRAFGLAPGKRADLKDGKTMLIQ